MFTISHPPLWDEYAEYIILIISENGQSGAWLAVWKDSKILCFF
jgi:hypothetical protein